MFQIKEHILFKILTIILVIALITPTLAKLGHIFESHTHEVCTIGQQSHLHTLDIDCEFYKFKTSKNFTFTVISYNLLLIKNNHIHFHSQYEFITEYQHLPFALRGPPQLV